jgi:serine/threonine-protein kinase
VEALTTGTVLVGRYHLGEPLGSGGSGTVWAAHDERLDRDVAVKVWSGPAQVAGTPDDETHVLATLSHPGVVVVHDAGVQEGVAFLVMERVEGPSLAELLRTGPLDPERAAGLLAQLARTLDHLHAQGLVHGDVKPANVLVPPDDHVKLADFGGVRRTGEKADRGTPGWLSPEVASGAPLTPAGDVWALGTLLRACLDGLPDVPDDLAAVVAECTDSDPVRRPSAAAVAVRLEVRGGGHTMVLPLPPGTPSRGLRLWPAAAAVLVALLLLALTAPDQGGDSSAVVPPSSVPAAPSPTPSPTARPSPSSLVPVAPPPQLVQRQGNGHGKGRGRH